MKRLYQDKIEAARRMSFAEKFMAGAEMFDRECEISMAEIRMQHPDFGEEQVLAELRRRLGIARLAEEQPYEVKQTIGDCGSMR